MVVISRAMTTDVLTPRHRVRLEAVPCRMTRTAGTAGASGEDRPPHERASGEYRESSERRAHPLPSTLVGLRVLVVDDDQDTVELFAAALAACGAAVTMATTAVDALRLVIETQPHVVLSDIAMPGGDGYWLVGEIRRIPDATISRVPVVAATAYGREHGRGRALASGFVDHLQKPVDPELLCRTVARAAGR